MSFTYVAIGGNLPPPAAAFCPATTLQICAGAVRHIADIPGVSDVVRGRWYSSAPIPASAQPRYINGVVRLRCVLSPAALLTRLQAIEAAAGRVRSAANAARILDLDIIDMAGLVRAAPDPILPHPRAHQRGFVLLPLRDVAPGWVHPGLGQPIQALIAALPPQDVQLA